MSVKLHRRGVAQARELIAKGRSRKDERDDWSEHQPSAARENDFIQRFGWAEFGRWHLGIDDAAAEETKRRYKFPYGDLARVHRCALISAESRAGQYKYLDIEAAAKRLLQMMDRGSDRPMAAPARRTPRTAKTRSR
jgi:hypothetical protein